MEKIRRVVVSTSELLNTTRHLPHTVDDFDERIRPRKFLMKSTYNLCSLISILRLLKYFCMASGNGLQIVFIFDT